jgi:GxxExxY protein
MAHLSTYTRSRAGAFHSLKCHHEDHEETKTTKKTRNENQTFMINKPTPLSDETERLMHDTIGCCIGVHRGLGPGLLEKIYSRAMCVELTARGISFEREKRYPVRYRGELLAEQVVDLIVGEQIVLEIKSVEQLSAVHHRQIVNYMRVACKRAGLLVNFNVALLIDGLSRKVL